MESCVRVFTHPAVTNFEPRPAYRHRDEELMKCTAIGRENVYGQRCILLLPQNRFSPFEPACPRTQVKSSASVAAELLVH